MKEAKTIPLINSAIIETHFHLDYLKEKSFEEILSDAASFNVKKLITICVADKNINSVIELANTYENVYTTQGIHPHEAKNWNREIKDKIISNMKEKKVVAIGEIGLDYHYNKSDRASQINCFEEQLQIATDYNLPVVIHTREAEEDTKSILKNFLSNSNLKGVLHSFTSSQDLANFAIKENFCIGVNGIITFKNAHELREVVKTLPVDRILIETDAPFLTPIPFRGMENAPKYLPCILSAISQLLNLDAENLGKQIYQNSLSLFTRLG